ncbi:MAG: 30S ribosomal protein S7 [Candidatus Aenigmatarchaeota archaeon]
MSILLFNRWDTSKVEVQDPSLKRYVNLEPVIVPRTNGKMRGQHKYKVNIVERFTNRLMVNGHRGKKHKITSGHHVGNTATLFNHMKAAFTEIENKTKKDPVQVLVHAIENSSVVEEVASYRMGGIMARKAVVVSPQRRLDLALRYLTQGIYKKSFKNRQPLSRVIADELIAAANNDTKVFAIQEKNRIEREAEGAR